MRQTHSYIICCMANLSKMKSRILILIGSLTGSNFVMRLLRWTDLLNLCERVYRGHINLSAELKKNIKINTLLNYLVQSVMGNPCP